MFGQNRLLSIVVHISFLLLYCNNHHSLDLNPDSLIAQLTETLLLNQKTLLTYYYLSLVVLLLVSILCLRHSRCLINVYKINELMLTSTS